MEFELIFRMACQWLLVFMMAVAFMSCAETDFNGQRHKEPKGFDGFKGTIFAFVIFVGAAWGAGAFDVLFGG